MILKAMLFLLLLFCSLGRAQQMDFKGKVLDDKGIPIEGVSIQEKGKSNGIVSEKDGSFRIATNTKEPVLVFSYLGFAKQEVIPRNGNSILVKLVSDTGSLNEVVVMGYNSIKKKDITGATKSIKSDDFNKGIVNSPQELIQGKVAGVTVVASSGEPGATQNITVRGPGGLRTGNTPLFVVDGLPLDNSGTGGSTDPLTFLNPNDIETIDVLKDASATAIYGSRGANGVIMITTKKGKAGTSYFNFSSSLAVGNLTRALPVFSADDYRRELVKVGGTLDDKGGNTNWQKEITRTSFTRNNNLSYGGGTSKQSFFVSLGIQNQEGVIKNNDLNRYNARISGTQKYFDGKLTLDAGLTATYTESKRPPIESLIGNAISLNPTYPATDASGNPIYYKNGGNPLITLSLNKDITQTQRVIVNFTPSYKIIDGLVYKLNLAADYANSNQDLVSKPSLVPVQDGRLVNNLGKNQNQLVENYLTYSHTSEKHDYSFLLGYSFQEFYTYSRQWSINKFSPNSDVDLIYRPNEGETLNLTDNRPSSSLVQNELQSFFGRINYQFLNKYLFTATLRRDGSTKFGTNNKYGDFPSFSVGWKLSEENFIKSIPVITDLKLRAGYGVTGNQEIPTKISQALFNSDPSGNGSYPLDNTNNYISGAVYARSANPDLKWETSKQSNFGLDFKLFNGKLGGTVDYFYKTTSDILLATPPADPIQPAPEVWINVPNMKVVNQGLELDLNYRFRTSTGLNFEIGGNMTFIKNKVLDSPYEVLTTGGASGSGLSSATVNGYVNNEPIGTFYLQEFQGINADGKSILSQERKPMGTALPDKMFNFYAKTSYKHFDFSINFNGVSGNKIYDNTANAYFYKLTFARGSNSTAEAIEYPNESTSNPASVSSRYLKDGAFLRLNNATIAYNFDVKSMKIDKYITGIRFSITGQNLALWTKYNGYDPEVNIDKSSGSYKSYGIDYLSYPRAKTLVYNLTVSF